MKKEVNVIIEMEGEFYRLQHIDIAVPTQKLVEKTPVVKQKTKKKIATPTRLKPEEVWKKSEKYSTTISLEEKDKILEQIGETQVNSSELLGKTGLPYHRLLGALDILQSVGIIKKHDDGTTTLYSKV